MTDETEMAAHLEWWRNAYTTMVQGGVDPYAAADTMLQYSSLMLEQLRGSAFASMTLTAGAEFMRNRPQSKPARPKERAVDGDQPTDADIVAMLKPKLH
jgi:hypothetical protein